MRNRPNGLIVYVGPSALDGSPIFSVLTGFARKSRNKKVGDMLQLWVLQTDEKPIDARGEGGHDTGMCGDCPIKPSCYVEWEKAPTQVWYAYHRGSYPLFSFPEHGPWIEGERRKIRLGACGEPTALPYNLVNRLIRRSAGWTGYTHQWNRFASHDGWKRILMASVESVRFAELAQSLGWRTFRIGAPDSPDAPNESHCPASDEKGHRAQCADCLLCAGTAQCARSIHIWGHGPAGKLSGLLPILGEQQNGGGVA